MTDKDILEKNKELRQPVECWTRVMGWWNSPCKIVSNSNQKAKRQMIRKVKVGRLICKDIKNV